MTDQDLKSISELFVAVASDTARTRDLREIDKQLADRITTWEQLLSRKTAKPVMTESEAAEYLGVKESVLKAWRRRGLVTYCNYPGVREVNGEEVTGRVVSYDVSDLEAFRSKHKVHAGLQEQTERGGLRVVRPTTPIKGKKYGRNIK